MNIQNAIDLNFYSLSAPLQSSIARNLVYIIASLLIVMEIMSTS